MCYARTVLDEGGALDGFLLAATAHDDDGAAAAAPGLAPSVAVVATTAAAAWAELTPKTRRAAVRAYAASLEPTPDGVGLSPRARALLASTVPRALGAAWLAEAPRPRKGYRPAPGLAKTLARFAGPAAGDEQLAAHERGVGRGVAAHALERFDEARVRSLLGEISATETAAVRALGALPRKRRWAPPADALLPALLRAARALANSESRTRALGALYLGVLHCGSRDLGELDLQAPDELGGDDISHCWRHQGVQLGHHLDVGATPWPE